MNYLEMPSFKPIKSLPVIRLIINSFTGNKKEVQRSEDIMRILKTKNYKISEVMDINQELIFDKDKSKNK